MKEKENPNFGFPSSLNFSSTFSFLVGGASFPMKSKRGYKGIYSLGFFALHIFFLGFWIDFGYGKKIGFFLSSRWVCCDECLGCFCECMFATVVIVC